MTTEYKGYYTSEALLYTIHSDTPVRLSENPSRFLLDASGGNSSTVQLVPGHLGRIGDYVRFVCGGPSLERCTPYLRKGIL